MWDLAVREEDYTAADSMLERFTVAPRFTTAPLSYRAFSVFARGDSTARARILEEARSADNRQSQIGARYIATHLGNLPAAAALARLDLQPRRNPAIRRGAQELLAWLEVAGGRWSGAKTEFAAAERAEGVEEQAFVTVSRAFAATLPFLAVPPTDLEAIRAEVDRWSPPTDHPVETPSISSTLRPHLRLYLLGLLSSRLGDETGALRFAAELERRSAPPAAAAVVQGLAQTVRADVLWRRRRAAEALETLAPIKGAVPLELVSVPAYANLREYSQEHARYLRAELLHALGRDAEALRWFETAFQGAPNELAYLAPIHLRQGEIHERMGDRDRAVLHYGRFVKLWANCDPELRPLVEQARVRLARLAAEPR
jgi:tetratricopeptide (TPR) repeat protein